jgi:hypothetical protein
VRRSSLTVNMLKHLSETNGGLIALIACVSLLSACAGYVPGRKSAWDSEISALCAKDGGVQMVEQIVLTPEQADLMREHGGRISVRTRSGTPSSWPIFAEMRTSYLNKASPVVTRTETEIVRRSDSKVVAKWVMYARSGGDFPTGLAHESVFSCPDIRGLDAQIQRLFVIRGE